MTPFQKLALEAALIDTFGTKGHATYRYDGKTDRQIVRDLMRAEGFDDATIDAADPTGTLGAATAKLFAVPPAKMREDSVDPRVGESYVAFIHPDQSYDLRLETGDQGWLRPHQYSDIRPIYAGEVGQFVGNVFIETPRVAKDAGTGRYTAYVLGRQAVCEAVAVEPHVVVGPVVDKLKRFYPLGWYGLLGWNVFRNEAIWKVFTGSSIAAL